MRASTDKIVNGTTKDGFDYKLQVWVTDYIIHDCGHPQHMKDNDCCNANILAGQDIRNIYEKGGN